MVGNQKMVEIFLKIGVRWAINFTVYWNEFFFKLPGKSKHYSLINSRVQYIMSNIQSKETFGLFLLLQKYFPMWENEKKKYIIH